MENKLFELTSKLRSVVPDGYAVLNLIALGGKGETKKGYTERDFDFGKIHYERF